MTTPLRVLLPALLLLSACGVKFDHSPLESYTKPGVSRAQKAADLRRCEEALQRAGGSVAKSAYQQRSRTKDCLERQGYSNRPRHP